VLVLGHLTPQQNEVSPSSPITHHPSPITHHATSNFLDILDFAPVALELGDCRYWLNADVIRMGRQKEGIQNLRFEIISNF
jgi:hypothetical protein